ncbi:hypothetical protein [Azospirillum brasilense]|uniref:hypothetical protein n=1 Tax=Azospirillum brasilense TaxID=192 RepID=UPI001EDA223A|nr:hypothetical protein [Azospirillum brasilense]UKJ74252.1 hypothetical protein H1Q64_06615 [Azospirillum brasilense]
MQLTDQQKALGRAQGEATARFIADPSPINRAALMHAIRRSLRALYGDDKKAIQFLDDAYQHFILDALVINHAAHPDESSEVA